MTKQKPISAAFIAKQKKVLIELQERLGGVASNQRIVDRTDQGSSDLADAGAVATAVEEAMSLVSNTSQTLRDVCDALKKIDRGCYGVCEISQVSIGKERLEAIPWARFTVQVQGDLEKRGLVGSRSRSSRDLAAMFGDSAEPDDQEGGQEDDE